MRIERALFDLSTITSKHAENAFSFDIALVHIVNHDDNGIIPYSFTLRSVKKKNDTKRLIVGHWTPISNDATIIFIQLLYIVVLPLLPVSVFHATLIAFIAITHHNLISISHYFVQLVRSTAAVIRIYWSLSWIKTVEDEILLYV